MTNSETDKERRHSRRFQVAWDMFVAGKDRSGCDFDEAATLANLSSGGAFFYAHRSLDPRATLELRVRVPFKRENWMKYAAQITRLEENDGVAVRFDEPRPVFILSE
ncbi:MAG TPA: PilZ domain-containing protein [Blastocatellia bacterium]|nr:PilZ domain-containing protein [Blastocatellia bacterium]